MKKHLKSLFLSMMILLQFASKATSAHIISFFFDAYPDAKNLTFEKSKNFEGINVFYQGYLTTSDQTGQITFEKKHKNNSLVFVVTPEIKPAFMIANTIHHWQTKSKEPYDLYSCNLELDQDTGLNFWNIKKQQNLIKNYRIPLNGIVICANPSDIVIEPGISILKKAPVGHILPPTIYVKDTFNCAKHALYMLEKKTFFETLKKDYKSISTAPNNPKTSTIAPKASNTKV